MSRLVTPHVAQGGIKTAYVMVCVLCYVSSLANLVFSVCRMLGLKLMTSQTSFPHLLLPKRS